MRNFIPVNSQGKVRLRSLHQQPYDPKKEHLEQATQSAPLLVLMQNLRCMTRQLELLRVTGSPV
jgi:hypothetical protein